MSVCNMCKNYLTEKCYITLPYPNSKCTNFEFDINYVNLEDIKDQIDTEDYNIFKDVLKKLENGCR